jgi:cytochrome c553
MGRVSILTASALIIVAGGGFLAMTGTSRGQSGVTRSGDRAQGLHVVEAKCAQCHGADGNSGDPQFPKLAGQSPAYLYRQLRAFRNGTRKSGVMAAIAADLTAADMANAASFFGKQPRKPDVVKDQSLAAIGERIFFGGMPACAMCHRAAGRRGMPMMGMMAGAPNLNGQHAAYIVDQLDRFASGARPSSTMMGRIAASLSEADKRAVAEYLSGLR